MANRQIRRKSNLSGREEITILDTDGLNYELPLNQLASFLTYIPQVQPGLNEGVLTLDCNNRQYTAFEPRLVRDGTIPINTNYSVVLANVLDTLLINKIVQLTGTVVISFENSGVNEVVCSIEGVGTWNETAKTLTVIAGTADVLEMNLVRNNTASNWILKVSEFVITT